MKHFLYLHLRDARDGRPGQLLGNTRRNPALGLTPAAKTVPGRRVLWRLNDDGTLTLGGGAGGVLDTDSTGRLHLRSAAETPATWKIDEDGALRHAATGKGVTLDLSADGRAILAGDDGGGSPVQAYVEALGAEVQAILNLPKNGYPQFTGGPGAAYAWILSQLPMLMGGDLRAEYTRTDFEPAVILTFLSGLTYPSGGVDFTSTDFDGVKGILATELTYASAVVTNIAQTVQFWQQVFSDDSGYLNSLQTDLTAASSSPPSVGLLLATLFENILYTAFCVFDAPGGFIANLMATAFNTTVASLSGGGDGPLSFAQLQDALRIDLDRVLTALATQKDTLLANGNMAQALATFVHQNAPTNTGLNNAKLTAEYVYLQQVLQNALPGLCTWYGQYFTSANPTPPSNVPSYNSCAYSNSEGNFLFWLQMNSGQAVPALVTTLMCTGMWIEASGANPAAMFLGLEGWRWSTAHSEDYDADSLVLSVTNDTPLPLQVKVKAKHHDGKVLHPSPPKGHDTVKIDVEPGGAAIVVGGYESGLVLKVDVTPARSSGADDADPIASFHCHQHTELAGGPPWVSALKVADGYELPAPNCIYRRKALQSQPGMIFAVLSATSA